MQKKIPIGIENFKDLVNENYLYIDKTKFIEEIINDGAKVKLFTRPRRFGKTLNMSMLKYFFDIRESKNNKELFDKLYIKKSPIFIEQGKYPVIFISMKGIQSSSIENCIDAVRLLLESLFKEYRDIFKNLDEFDKLTFMKYATEKLSTEEVKKGLKILCDILSNYYKQQVIILIDEYDAPLTYAYGHRYYKEAVDFFKTLYGNVLKTNSNLKMGVLTGAIRVAQAGIFSDLNNLKVNTILNKAYDEYFGLTESEVEISLKEYNIEYKIDEVKNWYDGYKFGNAEVYNPWSILNYIDNKELKPYWVNTSGNILIKNLLLCSEGSVFEELDDLVKGKEKNIYINESVALGNNLESDNLWELMLFSGYLTIKEKISNEEYIVKIPNREIQSFFKNLFAEIVFKEKNNIANMKGALDNGNIRTVVRILENVVLNAMSFYDSSKKYENPYQTLLAGFLYALDDYYKMIPNVETGYGRADIILKPKNKNKTGYIFELKRAKTKDLEKEAERAFEQIEEKKYDTLLINDGVENIIKIGLVFDGKKAVAYY
ncbi:AAA family ATPase [Fusobacterium sp.]|uniref:AAA family ATPase n=1 Tax=Fusobacterium sp. TaxID=68766 RepID=UPI002611146C|nr:AAA family ATPase [Fusobacterium sp.]